jgi:ribonuclease P protein component
MIGVPTGDNRQTGKPQAVREGRRGLTRHQRIAVSADFQRIFGNGRKYVGKYVIMWIDQGPGRVGVVAAKKTFRRAVDRNRAKRLMREAFRLTVPQSDCDGDMVLLGRRRILEVKMQEVKSELSSLLRDAGVTV